MTTLSQEQLLEQVRAAAAEFTRDDGEAAATMEMLAADVARARSERLPLFPVIHHSPASAVHMVRWLREKQPKLVFIELCEDLREVAEDLRDCVLPVALQAFAGETKGAFPPEWLPLSVVAPITEFSAEYQAIAYALTTPDVELRFIDRSVDHVFQWRDPVDDPNAPVDDEDDAGIDADEEDDQRRMHGNAVGIRLGDIAPSFREFHDFLLHNARMNHFEEWSALYIEEPTINADTATYRDVMFLVGSLFRRLGSTAHDREEIRKRDRFMWTRIKQALDETGVAPEDCVFICGAAHTLDDDCPEWGLDSEARYDIPERSPTDWLYGFIPSSYGAIEHQFGFARGAVTLAEARWRKAVKKWKLEPFALGKKAKKGKKPKVALPAPELSLTEVLRQAPELSDADADELLKWCTGIVAAARRNRYMASTADAIAIYETSILLARMRSRKRPSAYDFMDAAETCLEKGDPPGRRSVRQLCSRLLGGDKMGQVGYSSLPPLVQNVYDRLAPVGITASTRRVTRVLMDFTQDPHKRDVSKLLWRLQWLTGAGAGVARPIMGELKLGMAPKQESWDVAMHGAFQREVIQLAFEGVTVEQVLEKRLSESAYGKDAKTVNALRAVEGSLILLDSPTLTRTLGERCIGLLTQEIGADDAAEIFERARRLVHHFRGTSEGLPEWLSEFVATGYQHYAAQLPDAFADRGTKPEQLAAMLAFVFTLESLALAMGCNRTQLVISIELAASKAAAPEKLGLLWAAEWMVQRRTTEDVADAFGRILDHPLGRSAYPRYLSGFLQALAFAPRIAGIAVGLLGRAFAELPDHVLLPWIPALLQDLRPRMQDVLPTLLQEAMRSLPRSFDKLASWEPPWLAAPKPKAAPTAAAEAGPALSETATAARQLLFAQREPINAWARLLGADDEWGAEEIAAPPTEPGTARNDAASPTVTAAKLLVTRHPDSASALARLALAD